MSSKYLALLGFTIITLIFVSTPVQAQDRPIQLALFAPVQIFPEDNSISGIRLSLIYGRNVSVTGLDWGFVNHTTTGNFLGVQFGAVGLAESDFTGWQDNFINVTKGNFKGLQWGAANYANHANGLQLAIVNYAASMKGVQIGLVNIIKKGGQFPIFPFVNWSL